MKHAQKLTGRLETSCQWSSNWGLDPAQLTCHLTFCGPKPVLPEESKFVEESLDKTKLGEEKVYICPTGTWLNKATESKYEAGNSFSVACGDNGLFQEAGVWPVCLEGKYLFSPS